MLPNSVSNPDLLNSPEADLSFYKFPSSVSMGYETGLTRDERYLINKMRMKHLEKLENKIDKE